MSPITLRCRADDVRDGTKREPIEELVIQQALCCFEKELAVLA